MSQQTTIRKLATLVNTPVEKLLEQLAEAGMEFSDPDQVMTSAEKLKLLGFLRRSYGRVEKAADKVVVRSRINVDGGKALGVEAGSKLRNRLMEARLEIPATVGPSVHSSMSMTPAEFLRKFGITSFYHFTDTRNLPSIRAYGGLLPWSQVKGSVLAPGGNDWSHDADAIKGQDQYVHLCFLPEHPMEFVAKSDGRILESRFLRIDPSIIHTPGILFCPDVANKSGVAMFSLSEAVAEMDFEIIAAAHKQWLDPPLFERKKKACKYEMLVPGKIPLSLISGI